MGLPFFGVAPVQLATRRSWKGFLGLSLLLGGAAVVAGANRTIRFGVLGGIFSLFDDDSAV